MKHSLSDATAMFRILADSLVVRRSPRDEPARGAIATTNSHALSAYLAGHKALNAWDLEGAVAEFRRASELIPSTQRSFVASTDDVVDKRSPGELARSRTGPLS